ncbi:hypothetical protein MNB_SUP05-SYMBIONT-4-653 [hydrothermal vent metagenome]|uniref:Uncharacterized protein n=1 Tax=hydrothermal vent metagenome TaxID=652676 RepID=A0A1W1E556_9ZZZZ
MFKKMNHQKPITIIIFLFLASLVSSTAISSVSNVNELLALKKIEQYIGNTSHLINNAEPMQTDGARYKFDYPALRQDLTAITESINRFINKNQKNQTPRTIAPLIMEY